MNNDTRKQSIPESSDNVNILKNKYKDKAPPKSYWKEADHKMNNNVKKILVGKCIAVLWS